MRKKSHISLARYIVANTKDEELKKHKLSFYIGSILPGEKNQIYYSDGPGAAGLSHWPVHGPLGQLL